jgi:hypothetical protein
MCKYLEVPDAWFRGTLLHKAFTGSIIFFHSEGHDSE